MCILLLSFTPISRSLFSLKGQKWMRKTILNDSSQKCQWTNFFSEKIPGVLKQILTRRWAKSDKKNWYNEESKCWIREKITEQLNREILHLLKKGIFCLFKWIYKLHNSQAQSQYPKVRWRTISEIFTEGFLL